jgi:hypothetical protein
MAEDLMRRALLGALVVLVAACNGRSLALQDGATPDGGGMSPDAAPGAEAGPPADGPLVVPDTQPTACATSADCLPKWYCYIEGACVVTGAVMGECRPTFEDWDCYQALDPVCGCDGTTYPNDCMAQAAGVNVAYKGDCTKQCGNLMYLPACPPDEVCDFKSCNTAVGECVKKPTPQDCQVLSGPVVCGCDNNTYATDCERILAGVALSHAGACQPMVTVVTDKTSYDPGEQVKVTLTNGTSQSVFLPGCAVYSWHRKEDGVWVDKGPTIICSWEGVAVEVKAGGTLVETTQNKAGTWRLKTEYGVGCTPGLPLSAAGCGAFVMAYSNPFTILPTQQACIALQGSYAAAVSTAKSCDVSDPSPHCWHPVLATLDCTCKTYVETPAQLASIQQQYLDLGCDLISLPVCPPVACPSVKGSSCINGSCVDLTF